MKIISLLIISILFILSIDAMEDVSNVAKIAGQWTGGEIHPGYEGTYQGQQYVVYKIRNTFMGSVRANTEGKSHLETIPLERALKIWTLFENFEKTEKEKN